MAESNKYYINVNNDELRNLLIEKKEYQFIDVRTDYEYQNRRIPGFDRNLDFYQFALNQEMLKEIDKDIPVVLICAHGERSKVTATILSELGHKEVYNLKFGIAYWDGVTI
jgi:rhodanese-related sulfurtransferase